MSLFISSLNSGSNGNCYYIGNMQEAVLIDGGISCRETERRLRRLELPIKKIKAVFVTHEHADHIYGVAGLSKKHDLPVYMTPTTFQQGQVKIREHLLASFQPHVPIQIGGLTITAFPSPHDAVDSHNFIVRNNEVTVGVFTDVGEPNDLLIQHFKQCHAAFLETNYDVDMLETGTYPLHLKNRIRGGKGHLSNIQALQIFLQHRPAFMRHLFLSHLSWNNNSPAIVKDLFKRVAGNTEIIVASRHRETKVVEVAVEGGALNRRGSFNAVVVVWQSVIRTLPAHDRAMHLT